MAAAHTRRIWLAVLLTPWLARAEVTCSPLFGDHMVVQQGQPIPVWGSAAEGEAVTVTLADQTATTTAAAGRWRVNLPAMPAGGPHTLTVVGANTLTFSDVLVGEVWVCSGQSNMAMTVSRTENAAEVAAQSTNHRLRLLTVTSGPANEPQATLTVRPWVPAGPETTPSFSATAYFFGRLLTAELGVPVGLINSSVGGTPAEAWTSLEALRAVPEFAAYVTSYESFIAQQETLQANYQQQQATWRERVRAAREAGQPLPRQPREPGVGTPSRLFNGKIAPLVPYAIAGAIWYQGEANTRTIEAAEEYNLLMPTLIRDWRQQWGRPDLPFYMVQLAPYRANGRHAESWPRLREAQQRCAQTMERVGTAVITDAGDPDDIHPTRKQPAGERLALLALAQVYGRELVSSGPVYDGHRVEAGTIRLIFTQVADGLRASDDGDLSGFTIAGEDRVFHPATATVAGETVIVRSEAVPAPVAVRYGWSALVEANLSNSAGLPASPFRTDGWPPAAE